MLIKLIFAVVVIVILFKLIHNYKKLPADKKSSAVLQFALIGLAGVILLAVITGRMHWLGALVAGSLPFLRMGANAASRLFPLWLQKTGGVANFKTDHLDLQISIRTKTITGKVIKGRLEGQRLEALSAQELSLLADDYQGNDTKSYYFIKMIQKGFSNHHAEPPANTFGDPSYDEALKILGLSGHPSREEVIAAHRRIINKVHPDRGGSDFLASRVNQARDVLLSHGDLAK